MRYLKHALLALACALPIGGLGLAAQDEAPTPDERLEALEERADEIYAEWRKSIREAQKKAAEAKEGEAVPAMSMSPPLDKLIPEFQAAADDYAGTEDAVPFLAWIATSGGRVDRKAGMKALGTLVTAHAKSEQLEGIAYMLPSYHESLGAEEGDRAMKKLEAASPVGAVRAWSVFARLAKTLEESALDSEAYKTAKREMTAVMEGVDDRYLSSEIGQLTEVRETFSMGMVAPDIQGIDLDGTAFKLSDYKGQVLFVDFWGDW